MPSAGVNLQFQYPEGLYFLLLPVLFVLLYLGYRRWRRKKISDIGDPQLVASMSSRYSPRRHLLKFSLFVLAFILGIVAMSNPRRPDMATGDVRKGIDVFFAIDVSNSMLATDVAPVRLQKAKDLANQLIRRMPNDRIGLILFAGRAYLQMPLSTDHQAARMFVSTAAPNAVPEPGTAIGDVLKKADEAFDKAERFKTIILITDGETHDEEATEAIQELSKKGVMVNTVGIGSTTGSTIIDPETNTAKKDESGNVVISKLNDALLKELAAATNGTYVHLQDVEAATGQIMQQYQNVERKALPDFSNVSFQSFYWWFALPMMLLLLVEMFVPEKKKLKK